MVLIKITPCPSQAQRKEGAFWQATQGLVMKGFITYEDGYHSDSQTVSDSNTRCEGVES
jgi:hypothetical protein